jgi:hypothetical protein
VIGLLHRLRGSPVLLATGLATMAAVPAAILTWVLVFWLLPHDQPSPVETAEPDTGAVPIMPVADAAATATPCLALLARLPSELMGPAREVRADSDGTPQRTPVSEPTVAKYAAAWGSPAITLRCGVGRPAALTPSAQLIGVNGVEWVAASSGTAGGTATVWTTTSLPVNVEVTVPPKYQNKTATHILNPLAAPLLATLSQK